MAYNVKQALVELSNGGSLGSFTWTSGAIGVVHVAVAYTSSVSSVAVSGGSETWVQAATLQQYRSRRGVVTLLSTDGAGNPQTPDSGSLTITASGTGTFAEMYAEVGEVEGADSYESGQSDNSVASATSVETLFSVGTYGADDICVGIGAMEQASDGLAPMAGSTEANVLEGGSDVRSAVTFTSTSDENPGVQWNTSGDDEEAGVFAVLIHATASGSSTALTCEVAFSAFDIFGEASNIGITVNPSGELVLSTFDLLADDFTVYISGFTEIDLGTFATAGGISSAITAVISGVVEFGTTLTLSAASTLQRIGTATLEFGVNLMGSITGGDPVSTGRELVRSGAAFVGGVVRDVISRIIRRY